MHSTTFIASLAVSSVHADAKITEIAPNIRGATHVEQSYLVQCGEYNKQKKCDKDQMCKWNDSNQCVPSNKEDSPEEMPPHMKLKADLHSKEGKDLVKNGKIRETIGFFNRSEASGFRCDDKVQQTLGGYTCLGMDMSSFISSADLGSIAATNYTNSCPTCDDGFDFINDVWTYETDNHAYAIAGLWDGTSIVDVTNPRQPIVLGFIDTEGDPSIPRSGFWRDIKVVNDVAYIGSEHIGHGVQIFDLSRLDSLPRPNNIDGDRPSRSDVPRLEPDNVITEIGRSHNIVAFEEDNKVLVVGIGRAEVRDTSACNFTLGETVVVLDVKDDPFNPSLECINLGSTLNTGPKEPYAQLSRPGYVHDAQCFIYMGPDIKYKDTPICIFFAETEIGIYDMETRSIISAFSYPNATYVHQGWISEDFTTLYANDELDEWCQTGTSPFPWCDGLDNEGYSNTRIFDITSLENIVEPPQSFLNTQAHPAIDHNLYVQGEYVYSANYEAGARIYQIQDDKSLEEVAYFDMVDGCDDIKNCPDPFGGAWSHVPFSSKSITIASNLFYGLHVFRTRLDEPKRGEFRPNDPEDTINCEDIDDRKTCKQQRCFWDKGSGTCSTKNTPSKAEIVESIFIENEPILMDEELESGSSHQRCRFHLLGLVAFSAFF